MFLFCKILLKKTWNIPNLPGPITTLGLKIQTFNFEEIDYTDTTCIVIIQYDEQEIGLIVDEVIEVVRIPESEISIAPSTKKGSQSEYLNGISKHGNSVYMMLDLKKLLF